MPVKRTLVLLCLSVGSCSDGQHSSRAEADPIAATGDDPNELAQRERYHCGGDTDLATVERYFSDLEHALARPGPTSRFNRFVATQFAVTDRHGRTLYFNVDDVGSVTPGRIAVEEWREIHRRGERSLHNAGYRGCFMDSGKVWFEASEEQGFRLVGIAENMPWMPLGNTDSVQ